MIVQKIKHCLACLVYTYSHCILLPFVVALDKCYFPCMTFSLDNRRWNSITEFYETTDKFSLRKVDNSNHCNRLNNIYVLLLDRSLMIGWSWNSRNPEKVSSVFTFVNVCLCVYTQATVHTLWPMNLIFGSNVSWDMRKKRIFCFSKF